jgi:hypothetical protein
MIGIRLTSNITAAVFSKSIASFVDLINDVDSAISQNSRGSIRWDLRTLRKASPAIVEFAPVSRSKGKDYTDAVQMSILSGLDKLSERPEQPEHYSYSALEKTRVIAEQAQKLKALSIYSETHECFVDQRVFNNVGYLIDSGTVSLGSVRGNLEAITVHDGYEFRIWPPETKRPVTCRFRKSILPEVGRNLKREVEVFGDIHRNSAGDPFLVIVHEFTAIRRIAFAPIMELSGLLRDMYSDVSLEKYMDELRNG